MELKQTDRLLALMGRLRDPETGCPWDLKQDFKSLIPYTIEEAYEVVDAIERNDLDDLKSELGDLLLQVVFHSQLAQEQGLFDFEAVAATISEKLIRRHPHVFNGVVFDNDLQRQRAWDQAKEDEKKSKSSVAQRNSVLQDIPLNFPALIYCQKIQDKAAHYGFDWPEVEPVFDKVLEELNEVQEAYELQDQDGIEEEIGDLLLVVVNLARHFQINPEQALKQASKKFCKRFAYIEKSLNASGSSLEASTLTEMDALWDEAKLYFKD